MQAVFNELEFRLGARDILRLDRAAGGAILVLRGCAWVTREGERTDHVLCAGQSLPLGGAGKLFVSAIEEARLAVRAGAPLAGARHGSYARRIARNLKAAYLRVLRGMARRRAWTRLPVL